MGRGGSLGRIMRDLWRIWRLWRDPRTPGWVKALPLLVLLYILSPIDFVPDLAIPGLGSLDDLVLALLALRLLLDLAPPAERPPSRSGEVIDATYRVLEE
ncbi:MULTISPECIES: DUF1232 domain-containing protein [Thermoflexus]|jgi:uncharacterized membrane protein YkvA (DUF1232 family)|uniref:DUF1232 domain-containing protein n=1 Tax=Thermoflexus TaxID=1495649 RepID=UPI001C742221|nr:MULTISPECIES: DUF1232 domain-containing protein [Thermoflexus]QWK11926.1 MAG: DUF1232 domain-containing protein [Thermoflexus hugenholtzii]